MCHQVSAPGVWLPCKEDVYLSVSLFNQYRNTRLLTSTFPCLIGEKFRFEKVNLIKDMFIIKLSNIKNNFFRNVPIVSMLNILKLYHNRIVSLTFYMFGIIDCNIDYVLLPQTYYTAIDPSQVAEMLAGKLYGYINTNFCLLYCYDLIKQTCKIAFKYKLTGTQKKISWYLNALEV